MNRKFLSELNINDVATLPLVVTAATARETKAKKPFLTVDLFDGVESIAGNYWDWSSGNIPAKNAILNVTAQVTEWQGAKQLNISKLASCDEYALQDFMPTSGVDVDKTWHNAQQLIGFISDPDLKLLASEVFNQLEDKWRSAPGAIKIHHAYVAGTLVHTLETAEIASSICGCIPEANKSLCIAAALLHDLGKLFSYKIDGVTIDHTAEGLLYDHTFMGANFISNFAEELLGSNYKISLLMHCILAHHGKLEHGAAVSPACIEAHIVHHADVISAAAEILRATKPQGPMFTERIWALDNKPHIQPQWTRDLFSTD